LAEVGPVYPTLVGLGHRDGLVDPNSTARFHWLADELRGGGKSDIGWRRAHRGYREGGGRSRTSQILRSFDGGAADLTLSLQQYWFWRASNRDAVYTKSGGVLQAGTSRARYVGAETDVYALYNFTYHLRSYAGYSRFFAGEFINKTGKDKDRLLLGGDPVHVLS